MLSDLTSYRHDFPRCGHCGSPLAGRFTRCPACHRPLVDSLSVRSARPPALNATFNDPQPIPGARLPVRKTWSPSSRALINSYDIVEEPVAAAPLRQRLRQPLVLCASTLVVSSAVYLGFVHGDDSSVGTPVAVSGKVQTQLVKPLAAVPQKPAIAVAQRPANAVAQKPAVSAAPQAAPLAAQPPATVATVRSAPVSAPPGPPPAARRLASSASTGPDTVRNTSSRTVSQPDTPRVDVSRHLRAAHADLQASNLAATKTRLAAAIAAQPDNRDALNLRSTLNAREQQRDALLSLARGCGYIARWACVAHNAGTALTIDSSSKEAQRLVALATRESQLQMPPPADPAPDAAPEPHDPSNHH